MNTAVSAVAQSRVGGAMYLNILRYLRGSPHFPLRHNYIYVKVFFLIRISLILYQQQYGYNTFPLKLLCVFYKHFSIWYTF